MQAFVELNQCELGREWLYILSNCLEFICPEYTKGVSSKFTCYNKDILQ